MRLCHISGVCHTITHSVCKILPASSQSELDWWIRTHTCDLRVRSDSVAAAIQMRLWSQDYVGVNVVWQRHIYQQNSCCLHESNSAKSAQIKCLSILRKYLKVVGFVPKIYSWWQLGLRREIVKLWLILHTFLNFRKLKPLNKRNNFWTEPRFNL